MKFMFRVLSFLILGGSVFSGPFEHTGVASPDMDTTPNHCTEEAAARAVTITVGLVSTNMTRMSTLINFMYEIDQQTHGALFPGPPLNGTDTCYRIIPTMMEFNDTGYSNVYSESETEKLSKVLILVGAYLRSLGGYSANEQKRYFVSTPPPFYFETYDETFQDKEMAPIPFYVETNDNKTVKKRARILSIWPSYGMFGHAMRLFVDLQMSNRGNDERILLLTHASTVDGLNYASMLRSLIAEPSYRTVHTHDIWPEVERMRSEKAVLPKSRKYHEIMTTLRNKLEKHKITMIVVYLEMKNTEEKLLAYESLFTKGAQLERSGVPWLIADMELAFEPGAIDRLRNLDVLQTAVYLPIVWGTFQAEYAGHVLHGHGDELLADGVEGFGLRQISKIMEKVVGEVPPTKIQSMFKVKVDRYIKEFGENTPMSLELVGYPRNVVISISRIAPFTENKFRELRAVFGRPETVASILHNLPTEFQYLEGTPAEDVRSLKMADYVLTGIKPPDDRQLKAVVVLDRPFALERRDHTYEGIVIDIYNDINRILMSEGIFLNLELRSMESYGRKYGKDWNGALGEVQRDRDTVMAIGQFSVTEERQEDFTFSSSFGYLGYTFIVGKTIKFNALLQFTKPFNADVWTCLCVVLVFSAIYIYLVDCWNPFNNNFENKFTMKESIWYSYLTVSQAGAPFGAYSVPTRLFSVFYWFFALVVVSCYTGNLVSFLTESILEQPRIDLNNLHNLPYRYGMVGSSSVVNYFENRLNLDMNSIDFVSTYEEGIERARNGSFILFGTSTVLKWHENHDPECTLTMHEAPFFTRGIHEIGFVMDKDWENGPDVSRAIDLIRESGRLQRIYRRWVNFAGECSISNDDGEQVPLCPRHFLGLALLLGVSIVASFFCLAVKLIHLKLRKANEEAMNGKDTATTPEQVPLTDVSAAPQTTIQPNDTGSTGSSGQDPATDSVV